MPGFFVACRSKSRSGRALRNKNSRAGAWHRRWWFHVEPLDFHRKAKSRKEEEHEDRKRELIEAIEIDG